MANTTYEGPIAIATSFNNRLKADAEAFNLLPWTKKRNIIEIRCEKNAVPRVISCSISAGQNLPKVADSHGSDLPCADRA